MTKLQQLGAAVTASYWALAHWLGYKIERALIVLAKGAGRAILNRLFKPKSTQETTTMSTTSVSVPLGSVGALTLSEGDGVAVLALNAQASLGGGQAAGIAKVKVGVEVDLSAKQVADLGFGILEARFQTLKPFLEAARLEADKFLS